MKRAVYVIELEVPEDFNDPYYINDMFGDNLVTWSTYFPEEGNAPIRLNVTTEGVEEI